MGGVGGENLDRSPEGDVFSMTLNANNPPNGRDECLSDSILSITKVRVKKPEAVPDNLR